MESEIGVLIDKVFFNFNENLIENKSFLFYGI